MDRYNKYLVIKNSDIASFLNDYQKQTLEHLTNIIQNGRLSKGKAPQSYVCVAADWPMYEQVWSMVESFVDGKPNEIEQLTARVRELEEFKANVVKECASIIKHAHKDIAKQLAASQLHAEQLREALKRIGYDEACFEASENPSEWPVNVALEALSIPNDTSALDAYVSRKVKIARDIDEKQIAYLFEERSTLTRQRDLAVEALKWIASSLPQIGVERVWMLDHANKTLAAIKESDGK